MKEIAKKSNGARTIDRYNKVDKESTRRKEGPIKGVDVKL